jgi:hypothetical protein
MTHCQHQSKNENILVSVYGIKTHNTIISFCSLEKKTNDEIGIVGQ